MTAAARKPHPHAAIIKQWADDPSIVIQWRNPAALHEIDRTRWNYTAGDPTWQPSIEYRIEPSRVYPETRMALRSDLPETYYPDDRAGPLSPHQVAIANAAIRHAIDSDQVVPKSEVLEVARQLSAKHEMTIAEVVYLACVTVVERFSGSTARELKKAIDLSKIVAGVV